jgi:hypothetical protein
MPDFKKALKEVWDFLANLFCEWDKEYSRWYPSMGKISFWITFYICSNYYWMKEKDVPTYLLYVFWSLLGYAVFKMGKETFERIKLGGIFGGGNGGQGNGQPAPDPAKPREQ